MAWQPAEKGTIAQDAQGVFHVKLGGQWVPAPKGTVAQDGQGTFHYNTDALKPPPPPADALEKPPSQNPVAAALGGLANGAAGGAELLGNSILNIPSHAAQGVEDIYRRVTGGDTNAPSHVPTVPLSHNAQETASAIGNLGDNSPDAFEKIRQQATGTPNATVADIAHQTGQVAGDVANIAGAAGLVKGAASSVIGDRAAAAEAAANAPAAVKNLGFRTAENSPIARNVAGHSGREALTEQNQSIADPTAGAIAGVPHGTQISPEALDAARQAPESVYQRAETHIPTGPLSPAAAQQVQGIGADDLVVHSPDTQTTIETQKQRLLSGDMTGPQVVNTQRALRFNGFRNVASEDPEQMAVGKAQLKMADALHQHMADTLPANAPVSADQLAQARQALAQNHTVESVLKGGNVDMQALARIHRANPTLMTGPLRDMAEFGDLHPEVSSLPSVGARYNPAGFAKDLGGVDVVHPSTWLRPMFGGLARRALVGAPEEAAAARTATPVRGMGDEFAPIDRTPQPPSGLTAGPMGSPPAALPSGGIPLADLLSHGVEQPPAPGLSLATDAPRAAPGVPFRNDPGFNSGELSLADEIAPRGAAPSNADLGSVMSQGVPEGIVQRAPSKRIVADTVDFPGGTARRRIVENDSGGGPASLEAQSRLGQEKATGTRPVIVGPEGDEQPLLHDVTAVDRNPPTGGIVLDAKTGKVINSGNMKPAAAQALVNRWKARRSLGEAF